MKKWMAMVAVFVLALLALCSVALADDMLPTGEMSEDPNSSTVVWHNLERSDEFKLVMGLAQLDKRSSTSAYIYGYTEANEKASTIGGTVTLQQWKNNKWNNYFTLSFNAYDSLSAKGSTVVTVDSGYYYRVVTTHRAMSYAGVQAPRKGMTTRNLYID